MSPQWLWHFLQGVTQPTHNLNIYVYIYIYMYTYIYIYIHTHTHIVSYSSSLFSMDTASINLDGKHEVPLNRRTITRYIYKHISILSFPTNILHQCRRMLWVYLSLYFIAITAIAMSMNVLSLQIQDQWLAFYTIHTQFIVINYIYIYNII